MTICSKQQLQQQTHPATLYVYAQMHIKRLQGISRKAIQNMYTHHRHRNNLTKEWDRQHQNSHYKPITKEELDAKTKRPDRPRKSNWRHRQ